MKIVLLGKQGCGKGTQAKELAKESGFPHISTGDLLRNVSGPLKKEVDSYMLNGKLVPDELIIKLLKERLAQKDAKQGFILDGFPRTAEQAKELDKITKIDKVIEIFISDKEAMNRLSGRFNCKKCGAIFNVNTSPRPKESGICDFCGSEIYQRADDKEEAIKQRLKIYNEESKQLLHYYGKKVITIEGEQDINQVKEDLLKQLF